MKRLVKEALLFLFISMEIFGSAFWVAAFWSTLQNNTLDVPATAGASLGMVIAILLGILGVCMVFVILRDWCRGRFSMG